MAEITFSQKASIEKFLRMQDGFVLDFSNRQFQDFVGDSVGCDISQEKYNHASGSKANRLRAFIKLESDYIVGKLLCELCSYWEEMLSEKNSNDFASYEQCKKIGARLKQGIIENIESLKPNSDEKDFKLLAQLVRESIEKNQPEAGLDRLHTFTVKYIRQLLDKHSEVYKKEDSLNAIFGKYVKFLRDNNHLESIMAENILKYSINVFEAFNAIRNDKSFAHDNPILNYEESVLIFQNISSTIKFIETIEERFYKNTNKIKADWDDLPF